MSKNHTHSDETPSWRSIGEAADPHRIIADMFHASHNKIKFITDFAQDSGASGYVTLKIPEYETGIVAALNGNFPSNMGHVEISIPCGGFQSLDHKESVARVMEKVLHENGIDCYVSSRID